MRSEDQAEAHRAALLLALQVPLAGALDRAALHALRALAVLLELLDEGRFDVGQALTHPQTRRGYRSITPEAFPGPARAAS